MMAQQPTEARALTELALIELHNGLRVAKAPEDFLARADAIVADPEKQLPLPVVLGVPDRLVAEGKRGVDVDNGPRVHQHLGELDRANAADARLWTYLAFVTHRSYMEARWPLDSSIGKKDAWRRRARDRWLMHSDYVNRGSLVRHGIARLWWVAHLTWDPSGTEKITADDPYAFTREVFRNEDRINAIFDREVGAIDEVRWAVLTHAAKNSDKATDKYIQKIMSSLTLTHGYRDVGALGSEDVLSLVESAASRVGA